MNILNYGVFFIFGNSIRIIPTPPKRKSVRMTIKKHKTTSPHGHDCIHNKYNWTAYSMIVLILKQSVVLLPSSVIHLVLSASIVRRWLDALPSCSHLAGLKFISNSSCKNDWQNWAHDWKPHINLNSSLDCFCFMETPQ